MESPITAQSEVCVIGRHGFIGAAIAKRFSNVVVTPTEHTKVLFHMGSYTHKEFEKNPHWHQAMAFAAYHTCLKFCQDHGALFVYPSSALVYEPYSKFGWFKKTCEMLAETYNARTLGLRIFPVYGPGENRSVIAQWISAIKDWREPIIYGDGSQTRDFIFIDDVVDQTLSILSEAGAIHRVEDIGAGKLTSFKTILEMVKDQTQRWNIHLKDIHQPLPDGYSVTGAQCSKPRPIKVSLVEGIHRMVAA